MSAVSSDEGDPKADVSFEGIDPRKVIEVTEAAWLVMAQNQKDVQENPRGLSGLSDEENARLGERWVGWNRDADLLGLDAAQKREIKKRAMEMLTKQPLPPSGLV